MSDWISVKDRLPNGGRIWGYRPKCSVSVDLWEAYRPDVGITHWMPATLPEPPKNAEDKAFEKWLTEQPESLFSGPGLALRTAFLAGWQAHEKRGEG